MQRITKVERAKPIYNLLTSQSLTRRRDFTDFDTLDAKIASAQKKIISIVPFRRTVSVEEQRAQKYDRFLRGRQIANMIYEFLRASGACDAAQGPSDLFGTRLHYDDVRVFQQQVKYLMRLSWKICTSRKDKIPFSLTL